MFHAWRNFSAADNFLCALWWILHQTPSSQHLPVSHSDLSIGSSLNTWSAVCFHVDEQKDKASRCRKIGKLPYACDFNGEGKRRSRDSIEKTIKRINSTIFCAARLFNTIMFGAAWVGEIEFPPPHSLFLILVVEHFLQKFIAFRKHLFFPLFSSLGRFVSEIFDRVGGGSLEKCDCCHCFSLSMNVAEQKFNW